MNNPFEGKAVKFETSEQLDHLAELARGYGLEAVGYGFNLLTHRHFRKHFDAKEYSNYRGNNGFYEIHYSDFVASIEAVKSAPINYENEVRKIYPKVNLYMGTQGNKIRFGGNETEYYPTMNDAWHAAYDMMVFKNNFIAIGDSKRQPDMVNHPPHYNVNGIEVIDVIKCYKLCYLLGNVIKYVLRCNFKGNKKQDLQKAAWYLNRAISELE